MADILKVFNFNNNFQVTNLFESLNLSPENLCTMAEIIDNGYDVNETRKELLEFLSKVDFENYIHVKTLLKETNNQIGLNEIIELKDLISNISKCMSNDLHNQLIQLFNKKLNQNISNIFFNYIKNAENSNDLNIDTEIAQSIYPLKNDIMKILQNCKSVEKEQKSIKEVFNLPQEFNEINKTNDLDKLQELKESYLNKFIETNDISYQQLLYETNLKINTSNLMNENISNTINEGRKLTLWLNNIGKLIIQPISENKWEMVHYKNSISPISTKKLKEFLNNFIKSKPILVENKVETKPENKEEKISGVMPKFILDIQDQVEKGQDYQGIKEEKPLTETYDSLISDLEDAQAMLYSNNCKQKYVDVINRYLKPYNKSFVDLSWTGDFIDIVGEDIAQKAIDELYSVKETCAGCVAGVSKPLFLKKQNPSKDLKLAFESLKNIDEFNLTLNKRNIDYNGLTNTLYIDNTIAYTRNKADVLKIFEMIDNNEDISDVLFEGLTKADLDFLIEEENPENNAEENKPDMDAEYQEKKDNLNTMAQSGTSNVTVNIDNGSGQEVASDDYDIVGVDDTDSTGKPSTAMIKNRNTGEIKSIDPHKVNINESSVKLNNIDIYLNDDESKVYDKVKEQGKLFKDDMSEYDIRIANCLVTKHLLKKFKNHINGIYFKTAGRKTKSNDFTTNMFEVAPPSKEIENWIIKNKDKFKEKYGKDYKQYLYGKAWNKYNNKKEG